MSNRRQKTSDSDHDQFGEERKEVHQEGNDKDSF